MSDTESKPVKGENDGEGSEHINLKVKGQVNARCSAPPAARRSPRRTPHAASLPPRAARLRTPRASPRFETDAPGPVGVRGTAGLAQSRRTRS